MNTFRIIFIGRQQVTKETVDKIKEYICSVYDNIGNEHLRIEVNKIEDRTQVIITVTPT